MCKLNYYKYLKFITSLSNYDALEVHLRIRDLPIYNKEEIHELMIHYDKICKGIDIVEILYIDSIINKI